MNDEAERRLRQPMMQAAQRVVLLDQVLKMLDLAFHLSEDEPSQEERDAYAAIQRSYDNTKSFLRD